MTVKNVCRRACKGLDRIYFPSSSSSSFRWAAIIIKLIISDGAFRVRLCCHSPPNSARDLYRAHRCTCMRLHNGVYGHRKRVCTESWLWEENPLPQPGNRTCVGGVTVRCSNQLSYIPSPWEVYNMFIREIIFIIIALFAFVTAARVGHEGNSGTKAAIATVVPNTTTTTATNDSMTTSNTNSEKIIQWTEPRRLCTWERFSSC